MEAGEAIRRRMTEKILSSQDLPASNCRTVVNELLELAGRAPFHRACDEGHRSNGLLSGIEPWRFYALDALACRSLQKILPPEDAGKIPAMLAAADALIMTTWLPAIRKEQAVAGEKSPGQGEQAVDWKLDDEQARFDSTITNMEHIAATAAAIENLLIAATARGIANYWSSGGVLRSPSVLAQLQIPASEILLGAVFLFPQHIGDAQRVHSKLRPRRTPPAQWSRWID